ncbi:T4S1 protein, partial [Hemiprocne comata]|nr:T4S1 protein [Hemiprocne comata]
PALCRVAMCVGKCSRIVGPCLLVLGTLSVAANLLLLFPGGTAKYLVEGHINKQAKAMPGVWGGGITVSTTACSASCHLGGMEQVAPLRTPSSFSPPAGAAGSGPHHGGGLELALLGAAACFVLSGVGLTNGPLCFYNASDYGQGLLWGYPFLDMGGQEPDTRAGNYLYDLSTWNICLEPAGVVAWNVVLFSLLLLVSVAEMVLASLQILNGCFGCLCGFCEEK